MRLVVDALAARKGGTAYAAVRLSRALASHADVEKVIVVTRENTLVASEIESSDVLQAELLPAATRAELPRRVGWETARLPGLLRRLGATHLLSWSGMLPRSVDIPVLCHVSNPVMFESPRRLDGIRRRAMARTAASGARFACPTAAMATLVRDCLGVTPTVIPYGVDDGIFFPADRAGTEIICVADFYPHKRHDLLLDAWAGLESPRPTLRLLGDPSVDFEWHRRIVGRASALGRLGEIRFQSGLDVEAVGDAYRRANVFVLASEHESFNLPLLEAQACGLPTVARDLPALRETGGPSTVFVAGDETDEWTSAIEGARSRGNWIDRDAVTLAAARTWSKSAVGTYETLVGAR
jgi:glycosyltransferase involved in cell wall biosynthesis